LSRLQYLWARKSPLALVAGGLVLILLELDLLDQTTAGRRHGVSMMVVMAVVELRLHLELRVRKTGGFVKSCEVNFY
jgi:hypothetical protein